ncbi:MAG: PmoA family protein [Planctomycetia bacterium]|nr:PmoA family protein [Planctomycetia bacterium]
MQRRDFFRNSALLAATGLTASIGEANGSEPIRKAIHSGKEGVTCPSKWGEDPVEHFTSYHPDFADNNIWIRKDNQVVTVYRTQPYQKYPYLYPLIGPVSRVSVTSESAQPWPHHRSVFLGLDKVNGGNYWQASRADGQILSQEPKILRAEKTEVEFTDRCLWKKPNMDPIIEDSRKYVLTWRNEDYYTLDLFYTMTPLVDVEVKHTNHGFYGVRVEQDLAPEGSGKLLTSNGGTCQADSLGKPADWIAFYGQRHFNPAITEGVAVFCPPKMPFPNVPKEMEKCPWFVRDYGNISPMPFLFADKDFVFKFPKGEAIKANYRIVVFAGTPKDVDLTGLYKEFYN